MFWKYAAKLLENTHAELWFHCKFIEIVHECSPVNLPQIFENIFSLEQLRMAVSVASKKRKLNYKLTKIR